MNDLLSLNTKELEALLAEMGAKTFAAKQLKSWLIKGVRFEEMTNLPKDLRENLRKAHNEGYARVVEKHTAKDGTIKFLLALAGGGLVECVVMQYHHGRTLCVSTQLGCAMGCAFCASGANGLVRNLTPGEMMSQLIAAQEDGDISNVVLMGSGEPLDNLDNVLAFIRALQTDFGIGMRHISLSTCGLVPGMRKLADEGLPLTLCISLHAASDEKRRVIMPVAKAYSIKQIIDAAAEYFKKTGRRIIIEYTLIRGFNDGEEDRRALKHLLGRLNCHINVIPLNHAAVANAKEGQGNNTAVALMPPTEKEAYAFVGALEKDGLSATMRRALGSEIEGACGQLKLKREGQ
jgi:23S rRNA (adenine2503-C2)-methyltransferase